MTRAAYLSIYCRRLLTRFSRHTSFHYQSERSSGGWRQSTLVCVLPIMVRCGNILIWENTNSKEDSRHECRLFLRTSPFIEWMLDWRSGLKSVTLQSLIQNNDPRTVGIVSVDHHRRILYGRPIVLAACEPHC